MKICFFQHVPFEGPGSISGWVESGGHRMQIYHVYQEGCDLESASASDMLIILGGPMNIYEEDIHPWLIEEKKAIKNAIRSGKKVLGLCLGAQLIADALGQKVTRNPQREIGWFPLRLTEYAKSNPVFSGIPDDMPAFHWHGDTFGIPDKAQRLAGSNACENQAFIYEKNVLALQFHLETTPDNARFLCVNCADEMTPGRYIQTPEEILADPDRFQVINRLMSEMLDHFVNY